MFRLSTNDLWWGWSRFREPFTNGLASKFCRQAFHQPPSFYLGERLLALGTLLGRGQLIVSETELLATNQPGRGLRLQVYF